MKLRRAGSRWTNLTQPPAIAWQKSGGEHCNFAMDELFKIFPDKYPVLVCETDDAWTFQLDWPRHLLEPIDPLISEQAEKCYGLGLSQLANYVEVRHCGRADFVFSMFHSRALAAPALAILRDNQRKLSCVVHVDAHHDLAPSLLIAAGSKRLVNSAFEIECSLNDVENIMRSIDCGFIDKGCFLTAFLFGTEPGQLFHVHDEVVYDRFWLERNSDTVQIGDKKVLRDLVGFQRTPIRDAWQLNESSTLPATLSMNRADGVWLDVDLDAFCNRFDGDSDRSTQRSSSEEFKRMKEGIARFLDDFANSSWRENVIAVSVAASPGFFPSEYWDYGIPTVCDGIAAILSAT